MEKRRQAQAYGWLYEGRGEYFLRLMNSSEINAAAQRSQLMVGRTKTGDYFVRKMTIPEMVVEMRRGTNIYVSDDMNKYFQQFEDQADDVTANDL